jgi:hypothetical protein
MAELKQCSVEVNPRISTLSFWFSFFSNTAGSWGEKKRGGLTNEKSVSVPKVVGTWNRFEEV